MSDKNTLDHKIYNNLIRNVKLENIRLGNLNVGDINHEIIDDSLSVNLEFINDDFKVENDLLVVNPSFIVNVVGSKNNEEDIIAFRIEFSYRLDYLIEELSSYDESYIDLFIKRNIPVNIWPYARELISSLTTKIGYPALIIKPFKS